MLLGEAGNQQRFASSVERGTSTKATMRGTAARRRSTPQDHGLGAVAAFIT